MTHPPASASAAIGLTEAHDLRAGTVPWLEHEAALPATAPLPAHADIAILGSGIMGAILAERLSDAGHRVALVDRRPSGFGSTAASTAEIMWAMDVPLGTLATRIGEAEAARRWRRVYGAVRGLAERIDALGIDAARADRPTLYLAGNMLDADGLAREAALHRAYDLPTAFLAPEETAARFGIAPRTALVSEGGFEVDPLRLTHALLHLAVGRGATLSFPHDVVALHPQAEGVRLETATGEAFVAGEVILATGYERAPLFLPPAFSLLSTFAIATPPGTAPLWRENAMIWEAADPYLYVRTSEDGRIIAGGEDIESSDEETRNALINAKSGAILAKLEAMLGTQGLVIDRRWGALFGSSPDGLPAIGPSALMPHVWLSAGYGGNGIAFAALAAEMLVRAMGGDPDPEAACFDPYRFDR